MEPTTFILTRCLFVNQSNRQTNQQDYFSCRHIRIILHIEQKIWNVEKSFVFVLCVLGTYDVVRNFTNDGWGFHQLVRNTEKYVYPNLSYETCMTCRYIRRDIIFNLIAMYKHWYLCQWFSFNIFPGITFCVNLCCFGVDAFVIVLKSNYN